MLFSSLLLTGHFLLLLITATFTWTGGKLLFEVQLFQLSGLPVSFFVYYDLTASAFLLGVFLIRACVISFSFSYISHEKYGPRFHWLVLAFIFSMALLIIRPNLLSLLLG